MTGRWLTPNKARDLLGLTWDKFNALVESGVLVQEWKGDHYSISETSVLRQLAAREGEDRAETADRPKSPIWTPWNSADDPEARDQQADYDDTPIEEGDDQQ